MIMWLAAVAIREINHDSGSATFRTPAILELWLESTTWGHPFIKANYWRDCIPLVRDAYLANAQNWVWEEDGKLLGFVSIMEGRFLAAMFVAPKAVRRGIGKALMQYVQQRHLPDAGGLSKKSTGDKFLPGTGFSHCRLRMAG